MQNDNPADPNPIHSLFAEQPGLRFLVGKSQQLQQANTMLARILPAEVSQHCHVQNLEHGCLTISTDHAAWATHLRYQQPQILHALRQQPAFSHVASIRVRVTPSVTKPSKPSRRLHMSQRVGDLLKAAASGITNEKLKSALQRLAGRANPSAENE